MTKATMTKILKANNKNKGIKWDVIENKKDLIVITNDYDSSIRFEIQLYAGEDKNDIRVRDAGNLPTAITYLIHGSEFFSDFDEIDEGIEKVIEAITDYFYTYY